MNSLKKIVIVLILTAIISVGISAPKQADAAVITITSADIPRTLQQIADQIAWTVAKMLVHQLTQQIVNLIRTGGQGGGALFVTNWQEFLLDAADQASGVFLKELKLTALCDPFAIRFRLILGSGRRPIHERFRCTVSAVLGNIQSFFNDFNNGGWRRWIELTHAPNNPYSTFLSLAAEKERREALAAKGKLNEALSGSGFLNIEECEKVSTPLPPDPEEEIGEGETLEFDKCTTVSPGKWLEKRLSEATNSDLSQLNLADSFTEIMVAAFQTLIQNLFFQSGGLRGSNISGSSIQQSVETTQTDGVAATGINAAIATTQTILSAKEDSLTKAKSTLSTLEQLKVCEASENLSTANTDQRIKSISSDITRLEGDVVDQVILLEALKDDRQELLLLARSVDLPPILAKTNGDINKVGSKDAAQSENNGFAATQSSAQQDLQACQALTTP